MGDINPVGKEICEEYIKWIPQPNFKLKLTFTIVTNSDKTANLPNLKLLTENYLDAIYIEFDLKNNVNEMD